MTRLAVFAAAVLLCTEVALAGSPKVGEAAPELGSASWVLNEPMESSIAALRGDVIVVEKWGVKCGPCLALIPHIQKLHAELGPKGLHIFAFEAQGHSAEETKATVLARGGKTYAVATGGASAYQTDGGVPHAWVIGVEGKVVFEGNPGDGKFDKAIRDEVAKVKVPGLGLTSIEKAVGPAVKKLAEGKLAAGRAEAKKLLEKGLEGEAKAQAEQIVARIDARGAALLAQAEKLAGERRYGEALRVLEGVAIAFQKDPEGTQADERQDALRADKAVVRELKAEAALEKLREGLKGKAADVRKAQLTAFAESDKFSGTRAAEEATAEAAK